MRRIILVCLLSALCASCGGRPYDPNYPLVAGDDMGGFLNWSPGAELVSDAIALKHCQQYGRAGYVTRINRRPGDYIAFRCLTYPVDRALDPSGPDVRTGGPIPPS